MWDNSQINCANIINVEQVPIYGKFRPSGHIFKPPRTMGLQLLFLKNPTSLEINATISLMLKVRKIYTCTPWCLWDQVLKLEVLKWVHRGICGTICQLQSQYTEIQIHKLCHSWIQVLNLFTIKRFAMQIQIRIWWHSWCQVSTLIMIHKLSTTIPIPTIGNMRPNPNFLLGLWKYLAELNMIWCKSFEKSTCWWSFGEGII